MQTITINLEQLLKEKNEHLEAIKHIDYMVKHFFGKEINSDLKSTDNGSNINNSNGTSRMQRAHDICEQYLKQGHKVNTMRQFLEVIKQNGVVISRGGLSLAFRKPNSNIYFDSEANVWKLKNQG